MGRLVNDDDLRRLFDLAVDSPLLCSGSFEDDDVELLARLAVTLGVDPWETITRGTDFESRHVHPFQPRRVLAERLPVREWDIRVHRYVVREETGAETIARVAKERADVTCQVNRCGKPKTDPIHAHSRGEQ